MALFDFPDPVNEVSARLVAGGVVLMALALLVFQQPWILVPLTYGFVARVLTGPTLSPLGQFVTRVLTPALSVPPKYVPGPPKRFAQGIGATFTVTASILWFGFDQTVRPTCCSCSCWWRRRSSRSSPSASAARSSRC